MSSKATLLWLIVALALGTTALFFLRGSGKGKGTPSIKVGDPVVQFDSTRLQAIRVDHPDGGREAIRRSEAQGWEMTVKVAGRDLPAVDPAMMAGWPVPDTRIQGLTRHLLDARARALPTAENEVGDQATVVTLEVGEPAPIVLRLSDLSMGGLALVEIERISATGAPTLIRAMIDDQIHAFFRGTAPREWRDRTALYGMSQDVSRVNLSNDRGDRITLGKLDGAWSLREPFGTPADPAVVLRLLQTVGSVQIVDFLDQGVPSGSTGLEKPAAKLTIETDRRSDKGNFVETQELIIGGPADSRGDRVFASLRNERVVIIDARSVAELKLDPTVYAWKHPARLAVADVGMVVLDRGEGEASQAGNPGQVFQRSLSRWVRMLPDGKDLALSPAEQKSVDDLLTFLCGPVEGASGAKGAAPTPVVSSHPPEGYLVGGSIKLLSIGTRLLESLEVGRMTAGKVTIRTGNAYRTYPGEQVHPLIMDLATSLPPRPAGSVPASEPELTK